MTTRRGRPATGPMCALGRAPDGTAGPELPANVGQTAPSAVRHSGRVCLLTAVATKRHLPLQPRTSVCASGSFGGHLRRHRLVEAEVNAVVGTLTGIGCFIVLVLLVSTVGSVGLVEESLAVAISAAVGAYAFRSRRRRQLRLGA